MSYDKRQSIRDKKQKRDKYIYIMVAVVIGLLIYSVFRKNDIDTVFPEKIDYYDKAKTVIMTVKNEEIFRLENTFAEERHYKEGSRIPAGVEMFRSGLTKNASDQRNELLKVEKAIKSKQEESVNTEVAQYEYNVAALQDALIKGDITRVDNSLNKLKNTKVDYYQDNSYLDLSMEVLKEKEAQLQETLGLIEVRLFSNKGGIITYNSDGCEDKINYDILETLTYSEFEDLKKLETIPDPEIICKIVDNFSCFLVAEIGDDEKFSRYGYNDTILLDLEEIGEIKGRVARTQFEGENGIIIIKINEGIHLLYDKRFIDGDIIFRKRKAYKIPSSCVYEMDGKEGVYIKYKAGIVKFRDIDIIERDNNFVYINTGDVDGRIENANGDKAYTISKFDEIFMYPEKLKDGELIN